MSNSYKYYNELYGQEAYTATCADIHTNPKPQTYKGVASRFMVRSWITPDMVNKTPFFENVGETPQYSYLSRGVVMGREIFKAGEWHFFPLVWAYKNAYRCAVLAYLSAINTTTSTIISISIPHPRIRSGYDGGLKAEASTEGTAKITFNDLIATNYDFYLTTFYYSYAALGLWRDGGYGGLLTSIIKLDALGIADVADFKPTPNPPPGDDTIPDPVPEDDDPYPDPKPGGPEGGDGDHDDDPEPVPVPPKPEKTAVSSGFITLYNPTAQQLLNLASYMWSEPFSVESFKKIFANPMDCILGLSIVPVAIPIAQDATVKIGNINTGVSMYKIRTQFIDVDCGSININEYWGSYLDYSPYTSLEIYLPYIGVRPLSTDDVMKKTVSVTYRVDLLSGACTAFIKSGDSVLYTFAGQCAMQVPISGNSWDSAIRGVLSTAATVGTLAMTKGLSAGAVAAGSVASVASTVMQSKPAVEKSGAMSGAAGYMGIQKPYIIKTRPRLAIPKYQNKIIGYPGFNYQTVGAYAGFTQIYQIHLTNIPATDAEKVEIERLLKEGVIV